MAGNDVHCLLFHPQMATFISLHSRCALTEKKPTFPLSLKIHNSQSLQNLWRIFEDFPNIPCVKENEMRDEKGIIILDGCFATLAKRLIINFHPLLPSSFLPLHWFRTHPTVTSTTIVEVKAADFNSNPERLITSSSLAAKREELANWASFSQGA